MGEGLGEEGGGFLTMQVCGNEECSPTDATGAATSLHPVTLHALDQTQGGVRHCILLLPRYLLVVVHQFVYEPVYIQTGINGPAQHVVYGPFPGCSSA